MNEKHKILEALHFAAEKHQNQRRKGKDQAPYINHPIKVAFLISSEAGIDDVDVIIGAILHDTVEDTNTSLAEISDLFGERVSHIVEEVTDDKSLPKAARKEAQIAHSSHLSKEAAIVKLSDKCCNIEDVVISPAEGWENKRRLEYLEWAKQVVENIDDKNESLYKLFLAIYENGIVTISASNDLEEEL